MAIIRDDTAKRVLTKEQTDLAPLIEEFSKTHILVGGTAIALQLGHRKSIDFDLFIFGPQGSGRQIMDRIKISKCEIDIEQSSILRLSDEEQSEVTLFSSGVKVQLLDFSRNPFQVKVSINSNKILCNGIPSIDLETLGAMKVYAMMYRKTIKDAVDVYFILKSGIGLTQMIEKAENIFSKLYKSQYTFEAILDDNRDFTEQVEYIISNPPTEKEIFTFLRNETDNYLQNLG